MRIPFRRSKGPHWLIEPYLGYGTPSRLVLSGRVLRDRGVIESSALDSKWRNLLNTFRRFRTGEVRGARVRAKFRDIETSPASDAEGYFWIEFELREPLADSGSLKVGLELYSPSGSVAAISTGEVLVPPPSARFGVISDIDDTVVTTNVTSTLGMLATVLFSNAHARTPLKGIAAFYRALQHGAGSDGNPIFYVSNGPWNLYGLLVEYFKLNRIPLGPLFLRDFGARMLFHSESRGNQKLLHIERILDTYERLPFILIGDRGERDPEIYAEVVERHPGRIRAIYIRSVDRRPERLAALDALAAAMTKTTTQFVLAHDSAPAAMHAAAEGYIDPAALPDIRAET